MTTIYVLACIYFFMASLWGRGVLNKFQYKTLNEGESLEYISTIAINSVLFPIGIIFRLFFYVIKFSNKENKEKGLGFVIEHF